MQRFVTVAAIGAVLGVVGTVAAVQAFQPSAKPEPVVQIAPAAQTVEPSPTTTVAPSPTATVAPKPVESTTSTAPKKAATVQRQATVAQEPAPQTTTNEPAATVLPPLNNHTVPNSTPGQTGVFGGGSTEDAPAPPKGH